MKVGIVYDDTLDTPDGVQQYMKTLAKWLLKNGHDVRFLVGESYDTKEFKDKVISLTRNATFKTNENTMSAPYLPNVLKLRAVLKEELFDVLHFQMPFSPFLSQIFSSFSDIPKVGTFHTVSSSQVTSFIYNLASYTQKGSLKDFEYITTVSDAAHTFAKKTWGIDSEIIPNMVDIEKFQKGTPIKKYKDGKINIFFLGRFVKRKGADHLINAYNHLIENMGFNPDELRLIIGGKGEMERSLKKLVKKYKLKNVEFLGYVEEEKKADYYASADIAVFPATGGESFGIVLIEAMSLGLPIIAGNNVGYKTVMKDLGSLFLVNPKDTKLFAEKLSVMLKYPDLRKKMSDWSIEEVKKYSVDRVGEQLIELYNKAIFKRKTKPQKYKNWGKIRRIGELALSVSLYSSIGIPYLFKSKLSSIISKYRSKKQRKRDLKN